MTHFRLCLLETQVTAFTYETVTALYNTALRASGLYWHVLERCINCVLTVSNQLVGSQKKLNVHSCSEVESSAVELYESRSVQGSAR